MNTMEKFFSTEKMIYPIIASIVFGGLLKIVEIVFNITVPEMAYWAIIIIGFILGNQYKMNKLENKKQRK